MKLQKNDPQKGYEFFKEKISFTAGPAELKRWIDEKESMNIIDVRRPEDYERGHVPGAMNVPKEKWDSAQGLSKDKVNVIYCYSQQCHLAASAAVEFTQKGFSCVEMEGGFDAWQKYKLPVQSLAGAAR